MIRQAEIEDLADIHNLVYELAVYEKEENALTASLKDYQRDFADGIFEAIVLEEENEIRGMCLYYMTYSTWKGKMLYLEDFVVREKYRGHGYGQMLYDRFIEIAKEKKCRMVKWQVLDWNEPAIKFYKRNNAIIEDCWWTAKVIF